MPFRTAKTNIWQYDIQVKGNRFRGSCGTEDYEEAKAVEAQIRSASKNPDRADYTLTEALGTYYTDKAQHQPSASTTASQARTILAAMDGNMQIAQIKDAHILAFVAKQRATCSNATVNRRLQMLGRALRHMAKFHGATVPDLALKDAESKEPKERVRELSMQEQERLFRHLPADMHPPVKFVLLTGVRIATMCGLEWRDVLADRREMVFRLKGDESMTFPIGREVAAILSALPRSNVRAHERYVFTRLSPKSLERIPIVPNGGVFNTAWRKALRDAEIEDFRFHDLRHTFATRMLRSTKNIKLVAKLLGHTQLETTARYAHVLVDDMRDAIDNYSPLSGDDPQNKPQTLRGKHA